MKIDGEICVPFAVDRGRDTSYLMPTGWPGAVARSPAPTERSVQISRTTLVRSTTATERAAASFSSWTRPTVKACSTTLRVEQTGRARLKG